MFAKLLRCLPVFLSIVPLLVASPLEDAFRKPPQSARPWTYWMWIDGNVTREGITADLEAMARVGIGGVLIMDVWQHVPSGPVAFFSDEWRKLFAHAVAEADRLGIVVSMNNDGGWAGSGGPWNPPELSMQHVVWSTKAVAGGKGVQHLDLARPWANKGPVVKAGAFEHHGRRPWMDQDFYQDSVVLAWPRPAAEPVPLRDLAVSVKSSGGDDPRQFLDGNIWVLSRLVSEKPGSPVWVQVDFDQPQTVASLGMVVPKGVGYDAILEASDDGSSWRELSRPGFGEFLSFQAVTPAVAARHFRISFPGKSELWLGNVILSSLPHTATLQASSAMIRGQAAMGQSPIDAASLINAAAVVNLTDKLSADGVLNWEVPEGNWEIVRFGATTTGKENHPAPSASVGLESDKLSREATRHHFEQFIGKLKADATRADAKSPTMTHVDSWEVGSQNWTPKMREEFRTRRGYDMTPWLPALTGLVIGSVDETERFLWDLRRTISEMVTDNYFAEFRRLSHEQGMTFSSEAYGDGPFNDVLAGGEADVPMTEFWLHDECSHMAMGAASAAHTQGKKIVAAEAFTSWPAQAGFRDHPFAYKVLGDRVFCLGVNRLVFHRYAMQPWERAPGMTMAQWGIHFDRHNTWFEFSKPWLDYLARSQFLLQQGRFPADIAYFTTEGSPYNPPPRPNFDPAIPSTHQFDLVTDRNIAEMTMKDGRLTLPSGASYALLVLGNGRSITPELLGKIQSLVRDGAAIWGNPPDRSPGLGGIGSNGGYQQADQSVREMAIEIWGNEGSAPPEGRPYGKGRVFQNTPLASVMKQLAVPAAFVADNPGLRWIQRRGDAGEEIFFVANTDDSPVDNLCSFEAGGRRPELWDPQTGIIADAEVYRVEGRRVHVPLHFERSGSVFVVFRKPAEADPIIAVSRNDQPLIGTVPAPRTEIEEATYGVPGDPSRLRNVTAKLQNVINQGSTGLIVARLADGDDPAPGAVKTLTVKYRVGDRTLTFSGNDPDPLQLATTAQPGIKIEEATYGVPDDGARLRDVTSKLQELTDQGTPGLTVARMAEGDDPAPGVGKTLTVKYQVGDRSFSFSGQDADRIQLGGGRDLPFQIQLTRGKDGDLKVRSDSSGRYVATTAAGKSWHFTVPDVSAALPISGPWNVRFQAGRGAPPSAALDSLVSLASHDDPGIRYFSGIAEYETGFDVPKEWLQGTSILLDLGDVQVVCEVEVNGKKLGTFWKPPFLINTAGQLQPGANRLLVRVATLWANRIIGDEQLPDDMQWEDPAKVAYPYNGGTWPTRWPDWLAEGKASPSGRVAFVTWKFPTLTPTAALSPSGLVGPVSLRFIPEAKGKPGGQD